MTSARNCANIPTRAQEGRVMRLKPVCRLLWRILSEREVWIDGRVARHLSPLTHQCPSRHPESSLVSFGIKRLGSCFQALLPRSLRDSSDTVSAEAFCVSYKRDRSWRSASTPSFQLPGGIAGTSSPLCRPTSCFSNFAHRQRG